MPLRRRGDGDDGFGGAGSEPNRVQQRRLGRCGGVLSYVVAAVPWYELRIRQLPQIHHLGAKRGMVEVVGATATARCVLTPYQEEHRHGGSQPEGCYRCREEAVKRHRRHRLTRLSRVDHMSGATRGYACRAAADSTTSGSGFICPSACVYLRHQVRPAQGTTGVQGEHHGGPCRQVKQ